MQIKGRGTLAGMIAFMVVLHLSGCARSSDSLSEKAAVEIAAKALMGKPGFDRNVPVSVTRLADRYTVKFQFPVPGGRPGETYHSFVAVDARSGEVLELGVEQDQAGAPQRGEAQASRPSPLREEVDEVEKVQKGTPR